MAGKPRPTRGEISKQEPTDPDLPDARTDRLALAMGEVCDSLLPGLNALAEWYQAEGYPDPKRPVESTLARALILSFQALDLKTCKEIIDWLFAPITPEERESLPDLLVAKGLPVKQALEIAKSKKGSPVRRRGAAVRALDLRKLRRGPSWQNIADTVCDCPDRAENTHTPAVCLDRLRHQVDILESLLERLQGKSQ